MLLCVARSFAAPISKELQYLEQDCNLKQVLCFTVMQNNPKI